jgi:hypothetical protein
VEKRQGKRPDQESGIERYLVFGKQVFKA